MHMQAAVLKSKHCEAQPKSDLAIVKHHSFHLFFLHSSFPDFGIIECVVTFISSWNSPSCSCAQLVMLIARTCGLRQYELPEVSLAANDLLIMIDLHLDEVNIFTLTYIEIHLTDNFCTNDSFSQMLMIIMLFSPQSDFQLMFSRALWLRTLNVYLSKSRAS
ncbi:hypothetical protein T03_2081 [Trichinella britovi]|uniref:Uncharacterized protein n=1 Tax=Trichinella britovi TaxID=45882 RepID=A0A0V1CX52_TRIBR|nr:hypothetical protein T03_2081 [Trichinella britovi]